MESDVPRLTDQERERTRRWVAMRDEERSTLYDEVEADVAQYRQLTPERAAFLRSALVDSGWRRLQARPDKQAVLSLQDPPAADFEQIWARLVKQERAMRARRAHRTE